MQAPIVVPVSLGARSYQIYIQPGLIRQLASVVSETISSSHIVLVTDGNVERHYLNPVLQELKKTADRVDSLIVPAGEASKSVRQCDALWQKMVELGTDRKSCVVALGGGVVGDLAGFLAASFARGLDFVQIPTSLLAQVDSSVGGKVGINLPQAKNMVGAFWQPKTVMIDPDVLVTLDERNYRAGLAEVIKYGVIMDPSLFDFLEQSVADINQRNPETLGRIIAWCCQCKARVVEADETETTGRRAILNYGHTFGHAIEAVYGYGQYLHGEAIAIGMTCAAKLAEHLELADQELLQRQSKLLLDVGLPIESPQDRIDELILAMKRDKKVAAGKLNLILADRIGNVELVAAPDDDTIRMAF